MSFAHQAAKGSWASPIILFLLLIFGRQFITGVILDLVGVLFIIVGLALGIVALFGIREHDSKGILAPAIVGLVLNLLLLFIFVTNFFAARAKVRKAPIGAHPPIAVVAHGQENIADDKTIADTRAKAEKGEADAQLILGYYYAGGLGVAKDEAEAVKWYRKAADQNLATAQYNLATCYDNGQGVSKNMAEAVKWYRKAADQNLSKAQFNLGVCYKRGEGVAQNDAEAVKWYLKAAEQNYANAQFNLGLCCSRGQGVAQNDVEGYKWFLLSSGQGFEQGTNVVAKLEAALSPEQIAEGKRRANNWLERHKKEKGGNP